MPADETLAAARQLLAGGDVRGARIRLRDLLRAVPQRLDVRSALAAAYRASGDVAQAGRWSYLDDETDPEETAAFHRSFGDDPVRIMAALAWVGSEEDAATETARERLREVRRLAESEAGRPQTWEAPARPELRPGPGEAVGIVGALVAALFVVASLVVGAVTIVRWAFSLVT